MLIHLFHYHIIYSSLSVSVLCLEDKLNIITFMKDDLLQDFSFSLVFLIN